MAKKKSTSQLKRLDKYLYKNSYLYKWFKLFLRTWPGKILLFGFILYMVLNFGFRIVQKEQVRSFIKNWESFQQKGQYPEFMDCIDTSATNEYQAGFPEWQEEFFSKDLKLKIDIISIVSQKTGGFLVTADVKFLINNKITNQFKGSIYIMKKEKFMIYRVEI